MADELNLEEEEIGENIHGGGRFNHWLLASGVAIAIIVGVVLVYGLTGSGAVSQNITSQTIAPDDTANDRARVNELASYANTPTQPAPTILAPVQIIPKQAEPPPPAAAAAPQKQPSAFQQWKQAEWLDALKSGPLVKTFHDSSTLELARAEPNGASAVNPHSTMLHPPASPFTIMQGSVISAVLISGVDSDYPGPIVAQVDRPLYDTATGKSLLIPQGSKAIGTFQRPIGPLQDRVAISWSRLIFPDTSSLDLGDMPATDEQGFAALTGNVNSHYASTFGVATLTSLLSIAPTMASMMTFNQNSAAVSPFTGQVYQTNPQDQMMQQGMTAAGATMGGTANQFLAPRMNRPKTITLQPGFVFQIFVTKDLVLKPYESNS